jgi:hypothetical protein
VVGFGENEEEVLVDTLSYFLEIIASDYPNGLREENIEYADFSGF